MSTSSKVKDVRARSAEDHVAGVVAQVATRTGVEDHVA